MVFVVLLHGYKQQVFYCLLITLFLLSRAGWCHNHKNAQMGVQFTNQIISVMTNAIDKVQHKLVSKIIKAKYRFYTFHSGNSMIIQISCRRINIFLTYRQTLLLEINGDCVCGLLGWSSHSLSKSDNLGGVQTPGWLYLRLLLCTNLKFVHYSCRMCTRHTKLLFTSDTGQSMC